MALIRAIWSSGYLWVFLSLLIPALINGYPLVTSDTGAYISNAYYGKLPYDRPLAYSYFLLISSLKLSLWITLIVQAACYTFIIHQWFTHILRCNPRVFHLFFFSLFLILFSSLPWYVSQLMPDAFTGILFLSIPLWLFNANSQYKRLWQVLILISLLMHNSHLMLGTILIGILCLLSIWVRHLRSYRRQLFVMGAWVLLCWLLLCTWHFIQGFGFKPARASHVFLIAKMSENGILKQYLDEHCLQDAYQLCSWKDRLPKHAWDFIWNEQGPLAGTGSWDSSESEYKKIIRGTLSDPRYIQLHIRESLKASFQQYQLNKVGDGLTPQPDGTNPYWKVQQYYGWELPLYNRSLQNKGHMPIEWMNNLLDKGFWIFFALIPLLMFLKRNQSEHILILCLLLLFTIGNAWVTATLANVLGRLNSRATGLIPLLVIMYLIHYLSQSRSVKEIRT